MDYKIVNIVASTEICEKLDLNKINLSFNNSEYEPEVYFALIYRLENPKLSILVNSSGKIIFNGAKNYDDIKKAREIFFDDLINLGFNPKIRDITINNIVLKTKIEIKTDFFEILGAQKKSTIKFLKNPDRFVFKNMAPTFTAMFYRTGTVLILGLKKLENTDLALKIIEKLIMVQ